MYIYIGSGINSNAGKEFPTQQAILETPDGCATLQLNFDAISETAPDPMR